MDARGRVNRTRRQGKQGRFFRFLALANETADEFLSRPASCFHFLPELGNTHARRVHAVQANAEA
jgi:hypothetical protein